MRPPEVARSDYFEPGQSWAGLVWTVVLLAIGFGFDLRFGGAGVHLLAWLAALVIIGGFVALTTRAKRTAKSIVVTADALRVGERVLPRTEITSCRPGVDRAAQLWGQDAVWGGAETLTRDTSGVTITRSDGSVVVLPTHRPAELATALGWSAPAHPR